MAVVESLFEKRERLNALVQSKLKPSELKRLDALVEYLRANGVPDATRSSVIRTMVLDGLQAFEEVVKTRLK